MNYHLLLCFLWFLICKKMVSGCQIGLQGALTSYCQALWLWPCPRCPPSPIHQQGARVRLGSSGGDGRQRRTSRNLYRVRRDALPPLSSLPSLGPQNWV